MNTVFYKSRVSLCASGKFQYAFMRDVRQLEYERERKFYRLQLPEINYKRT